jgi:deoxyribodipyrimidine photo-lyase
MSLSLCWFRNDLRVHDNLALAAAMAEGRAVALYIATPGQWRRHDDAPIKLDFWRRNLELLEAALAKRNIPLVCCEARDYADIPRLVASLIDQWQVTSLHYNAEYPLNEQQRDAAVSALCRERGVKVCSHDDSVLIRPGAILNKSGEPFRVFTPFSRTARQIIGNSREAVALPARCKSPVKELAALKEQRRIAELSWPAPGAHWQQLWPAGESAARKRLENFCRDGIQAYKKSRDFPAIDGTSTLSPWLTAGIISIRECWRQASAWRDGDGVETWKNELLWREFYKHIMFHYPHISRGKPFRQDLAHVPWRDDKTQFRAWCEGRTGIPIIDAAMRQLTETGWMHNRLRMVTAMFLAKHLLIDWRKGEAWFMQHLVDGDFSANNGGWQWSASTGTDAVPYFRVFNPVTQSQRFDSRGEFIRLYLPELADLEDRSIHAPGLLKPDAYPAPIIDLKFGRQRAIAAFKG